ncbi:MAG TPA: protease modulator HflK, partial [Gemmata sp.]|nr:protease modulator HflK [Gemmata sp.]
IVQRFGRPTADLRPGLHFCWPWPIETITRIRPDEIRTVEVGFRTISDETLKKVARRGENTWTSSHGDEIAPLSDEAVMITGDDDLVEILATVRYHIANPREYLFGVREPDALVRANAESVLREVVAGRRFQELLTTRRAEVEREALERLRQRLVVVAKGGAGIAFDGFTLHDLHPPPGVVESYHKVAKSIQERDRLINEAEGEALRTLRASQQEATRILRGAETDAHAQTVAARADRDAFLAWHAIRNSLAPDEEATLAAEREKRVKAGENRESVEMDIAARRAKLLAERRFLVANRLAVQAVVDVLRQRDKILIDTADVPGRRHLFLVDPELFKMPSLIAPRVGEKEQ